MLDALGLDQIERGRLAVNEMLESYRSLRVGHQQPSVERLTGVDAVLDRFEGMAANARKEVCDFPAWPVVKPDDSPRQAELDEESIERGLILRSVAQYRTTQQLPMRLLIVDRSVAVVPLDPDRLLAGALVVNESAVVTALHALFDRYWSESQPVTAEPVSGASGLLPHERELLRILAAGHTDEVAARRLGVSVRTVRRTMAALCQRLDAHSRFQAGILAARQGWI